MSSITHSAAPSSRLYSRNPWVATALAFILGLYGFFGVGHLWVGRVQRGLAVLFGGLATAGIGIGFLIASKAIPDVISAVFAILFFVIAGALFLWQIFDAARLAREWNAHVAQTGRKPW